MAGARRDDEIIYSKGRKSRGVNGIIANDCNICTEERKGLVQVPGERIKVIYQKDIDWTSKFNGQN